MIWYKFFCYFFNYEWTLRWHRPRQMLGDRWGLRWNEWAQKMPIYSCFDDWWFICAFVNPIHFDCSFIVIVYRMLLYFNPSWPEWERNDTYYCWKYDILKPFIPKKIILNSTLSPSYSFTHCYQTNSFPNILKVAYSQSKNAHFTPQASTKSLAHSLLTPLPLPLMTRTATSKTGDFHRCTRNVTYCVTFMCRARGGHD